MYYKFVSAMGLCSARVEIAGIRNVPAKKRTATKHNGPNLPTRTLGEVESSCLAACRCTSNRKLKIDLSVQYGEGAAKDYLDIDADPHPRGPTHTTTSTT